MKKDLKPFFLLVLSFLLSGFSYSQINLDSLRNVLKALPDDTSKLNVLFYISESNADGSTKFNGQFGRLAEKLMKSTDPKIKALATLRYGTYLNNVGIEASDQGKINDALDLYQRSLKLREEIGDKRGMAETDNNLSGLYRDLGQYDKSEQCLKHCLETSKELNDSFLIGATFRKMGVIYGLRKQYDVALNYFDKAIRIFEKINNQTWVARCQQSVGEVYLKKGDLEKAFDFASRSLKTAIDRNDKQTVSVNYTFIGRIYFLKGNIPLAEKNALIALEKANDVGNAKQIRDASQLLADIYLKKGDYKNAYSMNQLYLKMKDSVNNGEIQKALLSKQYELDYEKHKLMAKAEQDKKDLENAQSNKQKNIILFASVFILLVVLIFAFVIYNRFKIAKRQKYIIEEQKKLVEKQKQRVEQSQKEIIDSINYAKLIQQAVLKEEEHVTKHLPPHFILFLPKDIVSGDFYWALEKANHLYLTAADCTGHGVPGAFLTMLGTSFLNEINAKDELLTPAEILDQLREKIVKELGRAGTTKDGMDISLMRMNLKTKEVMWAGANNPLWYFENGELKEIKPDKQPIGYAENYKPFTNHTINLGKGDSLYLFTDGYADQFGGLNGKKYKYRQLKEKLAAIRLKGFSEQKTFLLNDFKEWKKRHEQVDDVTVIGISIQ